jgi:hypothetical protein
MRGAQFRSVTSVRNAAHSRCGRPKRRTPAATPARSGRRDRSRGTHGRWSVPLPLAVDELVLFRCPVKRRRSCPCLGMRRPSATPTPEEVAWCKYSCSPLCRSAEQPSEAAWTAMGDHGPRSGEQGLQRAFEKAELSSRNLRTRARGCASMNARALAQGGTPAHARSDEQ